MKKAFVTHLRRAWSEIWPTEVADLPPSSCLNSAKLYVSIKRKNRLITASIFNVSEAQKSLLNATGNGHPHSTWVHSGRTAIKWDCRPFEPVNALHLLVFPMIRPWRHLPSPDQGCVCMFTGVVLLARRCQKI